ncbi:hypothetical protein OK349_01535 [Sphingomonas sp. BT-65]|uniref:hypothetical protein n=1 Tax=Sphingomonas sp. BT-65 TaxID=2989821 RepID=UPI0022360FE0|nr:hypothetical protein [Sphingomonas sp. BT-65]MCW4460375.1 hypothetical protein [Sphingomonas sp. BT-65]
MKTFRYARGSAIALLSAGPIFLTTLLIAMVVIGPQDGEVVGILLGIIPAAIIAIPFGVILGAIPILLGGFVMGNLGAQWPASRHPLFWAIAGGLMALPMPVLLHLDSGWQIIALFFFVGSACALIVRYGTRWSDDSV